MPSTRAPEEREGALRFTPRGFTNVQELYYFARALQNYADSSIELRRRFGDVIRRRRPRAGLWLMHPALLKRVFRTNVRNYPKAETYGFLAPILGNGLFLSDGELWTRQRRLLAPEFRQAEVNRFLPVILDRVERLLGEWASTAPTTPRDITDDMMRLTLWIVGGAMFKSDLDEEAEMIGHDLEVCLRQSTWHIFSGGLLQPWMPTPGNFEARRAAARLERVVRGVVARGRAGELGGDDVLSRLLVARDPETGEGMADQQIVDEVKSLILAGHETTSLTLSWIFYLLARHPAVEQKLFEESSRVLGDGPPRAEHVPALAYTRMVFLEAMRLYPPVPGVPRRALEDDRFHGVDVRAGDTVVAMIYAVHRHPDFWERPDEFRPERFAPERVDAIEPYAYAPFLRGRRACVGEHFAMLEGVTALAMLTRRFHLERVEHAPIGTRAISTLRFARPLRMRVRPR
ncbi:MAG: cytochrome P450 [Myxococcales bacterium]|nr:cytochrome P450 [Myxococcales bacterium]